MADTGAAPVRTRRALTGAVLLDLAVSPLFAWNVFTDSLRRDLGASDALLAGVFSVGLLAFCLGVLIGGRVADTTSPRRLALTTLVGTVAGLLGTAAASSVSVLFVTFGVLVGGSTGLGYATAVRVAGTVPSRRGLALGVVVSAYAAGTAVLAPVASALLTVVGRAWTFVVLAVALGAALALAAVLVPAVDRYPIQDDARPADGAARAQQSSRCGRPSASAAPPPSPRSPRPARWPAPRSPWPSRWSCSTSATSPGDSAPDRCPTGSDAAPRCTPTRPCSCSPASRWPPAPAAPSPWSPCCCSASSTEPSRH